MLPRLGTRSRTIFCTARKMSAVPSALWEVTQVNELLVQMETFPGIFVCATNLVDALDQASLRRFALKVEFLPLRTEQRCARTRSLRFFNPRGVDVVPARSPAPGRRRRDRGSPTGGSGTRRAVWALGCMRRETTEARPSTNARSARKRRPRGVTTSLIGVVASGWRRATRRMFQRLVGDTTETTDAWHGALELLDGLTAGDFATVARQVRLVGSANSPQALVAMLGRELVLRKGGARRAIGFG